MFDFITLQLIKRSLNIKILNSFNVNQTIQINMCVNHIIFRRAKANIQEIKISLPRFTGFITDFTKTESIFIFNKNDAKNMSFNQNSSIISINISNLGKAFARYKNEEMRRIQE